MHQMRQRPALGRCVHVKVDPSTNNGSDTAHANITRVWNDGMVNIRVTLDAFSCPTWMTSVKLFDTEDEAVANGSHSCYWPPRV